MDNSNNIIITAIPIILITIIITIIIMITIRIIIIITMIIMILMIVIITIIANNNLMSTSIYSARNRTFKSVELTIPENYCEQITSFSIKVRESCPMILFISIPTMYNNNDNNQ